MLPGNSGERLEKDLENQIFEKIRQAERENFFQLLDDVLGEAQRNGLIHDKLESLLNGN